MASFNQLCPELTAAQDLIIPAGSSLQHQLTDGAEVGYRDIYEGSMIQQSMALASGAFQRMEGLLSLDPSPYRNMAQPSP